MTITYTFFGLSASGAALIACDQLVHARGATERRHSWLKYFVYLVYLGAMISVRWWGWWPAVVAVGALSVMACAEAARLLSRRLAAACAVTLIILAGVGHLALLTPLAWTEAFFIVAVSDSYAQLIGRLFGRRQLCPTISPGKTVAGFVAGVLSAAAFSVVFAFLTSSRSWVEALLIGASVALAATVGDLFFSAIKRQRHVKDFSQLIPGHGGVLDRIDSLVCAAPAFYWLHTSL